MTNKESIQEETSVWGDPLGQKNQPIRKNDTFAERLKKRMGSEDIESRGTKFPVPDTIGHPEIIKFFHGKFKDNGCVRQLQKLPARYGCNLWNIEFSEERMVEEIVDKMIKFPSMGEDDVGVMIEPVKRRPTLITIPYATPDIPDADIMRALSEYGLIERAWAHRYEDFPSIKSGKKLLLLTTYTSKNIPPILLIKNQKILLSFKGRPMFCMRCNKEDHYSGDCPLKSLRTCYLCGDANHTNKECPKNENSTSPTPYPRDDKEEDNPQILEEYESRSEEETESEAQAMDLASPTSEPKLIKTADAEPEPQPEPEPTPGDVKE